MFVCYVVCGFDFFLSFLPLLRSCDIRCGQTCGCICAVEVRKENVFSILLQSFLSLLSSSFHPHYSLSLSVTSSSLLLLVLSKNIPPWRLPVRRVSDSVCVFLFLSSVSLYRVRSLSLSSRKELLSLILSFTPVVLLHEFRRRRQLGAVCQPSPDSQEKWGEEEENKGRSLFLSKLWGSLKPLQLIHAYLPLSCGRQLSLWCFLCLWLISVPHSVPHSGNLTNEATAIGERRESMDRSTEVEDAVAVCCQEIPVLVQLA